jgi:tetratricopeptide (TPR) repeat protein
MARRTVMISSTALDLPEHREQVRLACERAGFAPHDMMEHLTARNADAVATSLKMVEDSDVYLGIFAKRYGYVPDGHDISITEMEYDHAIELGKPRLVFFNHDDHLFKAKDVETGPGADKLEALKKRAGKERVAAYFESEKDLYGHAIAALTQLHKELDIEEAGDAAASLVSKLHRKSSIPEPPTPYVAHPYTLLQSRGLVGRQAELNALTDWAAKPGSPAFDAHIFCFVAIGGMGKSALTWKWFNQTAPYEMKPLAGRMWWSFYESDATFENFLNRALCYVSRQNEQEVRALPWQEREAQLLQHLADKSYLLVLDGLERILIAYNRMDAGYLADADYDKQCSNYVAGAIGLPATAAQSFVGQHRLRQNADPRAGAFLQKLAQVTESRFLITTRLYPSELQLPTGYPRPGCYAYFLRGLSDDDALGLWRALNVTGSQQELVPIFRSVENHPLLIQALASEVANYKKAPRDFARWRSDHPQFNPTSLPLVQSRTQILDYALRGLTKNVREVLNTLVGFRMPASYATLEALLVGSGKACNSFQALDRALTELEDRGLIGWDREANRYDAHPIVRGVVWQLTDAKAQRTVYTALEAHFEPMATPSWQLVETLSDLTPAIERYHTLIGLGRFDDAIDLFYDRLDHATLYRLAAYQERVTWLEHLFPDGLEHLPALTRDHDRGYAINALAQSYDFSGRPGRSVSLLKQAVEISKQLGADDNLQIASSNLGNVLGQIGALYDATKTLRQALTLEHESYRAIRQGTTLVNLGLLTDLMGDHTWGRIILERSQSLFTAYEITQLEGVVISYLAQHYLRLGKWVKAQLLADRAWEFAADKRLERDFIRAALVQGQVALSLGESACAGERLHHALTRARAVNMVDLELPALIEIAELEIQLGHIAEARARLDDVWEAAERGPYPLEQADAYNVLTAIELAEGKTPAAIDAATKAYKAAWCDGPPYAYHWGLQKAKAHLAALGAPEPDMPPFDESKFEPLPEVEINPKDKYWVDPDKLD